MKKRMLAVALCLLLGGCFDYGEIENASLITAVGIGYADDVLQLYIETIEKGRTASTGEGIQVIEVHGSTMEEALYHLVRVNGLEAYFGHTQILLFEESAWDYIEDVTEVFMQQKEVRYDMQIVLSKESMQDIFGEQKQLVAFSLERLLKMNQIASTISTMRLVDYMDNRSMRVYPLLEKRDLLGAERENEGTWQLHDGGMIERDGVFSLLSKQEMAAYLLLQNEYMHGYYQSDDESYIELHGMSVSYESGKDGFAAVVKGTALVPHPDAMQLSSIEASLKDICQAFLRKYGESLPLRQAFQQNTLWYRDLDIAPSTIQVVVRLQLQSTTQQRSE